MVHAMMFLLLSQPVPPPQARPLEPKPADVKAALAPDVKALVDRVQAFYEKTTDFTAEFKQDYTYKAFKRTQSSSGKVVYRKPGLYVLNVVIRPLPAPVEIAETPEYAGCKTWVELQDAVAT